MIRTYVIAGLTLGLLATAGYYRYELVKVRGEYAAYKANITEQVLNAKIAKELKEKEQERKYEKAKRDYAGAVNQLDDALARLRVLEDLSGNAGLQVAGRGGSSVPSISANTGGVSVRLTTFQGTCSAEFYAAAMRDNLQCERLIEFLSSGKNKGE